MAQHAQTTSHDRSRMIARLALALMMAQMDQLKAKTGTDFDIEFLSDMSEHHAMAPMMAVPVLVSGYHGDLYKLASQIVKAQGEEIEQMREWLLQWYGLDRPIHSR